MEVLEGDWEEEDDDEDGWEGEGEVDGGVMGWEGTWTKARMDCCERPTPEKSQKRNEPVARGWSGQRTRVGEWRRRKRPSIRREGR